MSQRVNIPPQNQPFRRQASIGGNVSFRNIGDNESNSFITLAKVTRVYYKQGKLDFKLTNTNSLVADQSGNGSGSAPIPVDFFGRCPNGKVFGHYRPIKVGNLIAVAYVNGHKASPIVIGVYPNSGQDYEIISPSLYLDGDDNDSGIAETALAEQKIYPSMQLEYRSGSGTIAKALNGHSFLVVDDETSVQYSKLWQNYNTVGFFHSNSDDINPLKETAGDWLLVHEDNPLSDKGDNHRTRFFVNKKGEIQIVLMDNTSSGTISVLDGSKDNGFTISQYYDLTKVKSGDLSDDVYEPDFKSATKYVSLNIGKDQEIALEVAANNSSKLELKSDGLYLNGNPFSETLNTKLDNLSKDIKDDVLNNIHTSSDFKELVNKIQEASDAAEAAKQAGEDAKDIGLAAEATGKNALDTSDDIKERIIYYASISNEKDVAIPGKYIIVNTDTYIANGTIKNAYIEDGAIDHAKIADEAVGNAQIEDAAITRGKIAEAAIGTAQIEDAAITDAKVGSLSFDHMIGATLDAGKINVINLTADNIKAHSITADSLTIGQLSDITGDAGNIIKGHIQASDDPNSGVQIEGLDADDPNKYTPAKKAFLLNEVKKLNSSAEAAIDYGKQTSNDSTDIEKAKEAMDNGLADLLADMAATTEFDYNKVIALEQDLQDAINAFHNKVNSDIIAQIGKTADGKNAIYRGTNEPQNPHLNDVWLQILSDGTYNICVWDGAQWINPGLADIEAVKNSLSNLPKSYYQAEEPVGDNVHDGDTWYELTKGSDGNYTYVAYKRESGKWTPLLNAGEVSNQSSIEQLQNNALMQGTEYGGLTLDKNGATLTSGNTHVYLNGTNGFQIQNGTSDVFHVDSNGNLTMQGNITGGDISGVNFTGNNLTLAGDLKVTGGHILLGDGTASLDSNGLSLRGGGLSISDNQGNQTTYVKPDGTFTTNKGVFTGTITGSHIILNATDGSVINANGGAFEVDGAGNVTAKSFNLTGAPINGGQDNTGNINSANITSANITSATINSGTITGATITGNTIVGGTVNGANIYAIMRDRDQRAFSSLDDIDETKDNWFKINGDILEWHKAPDEYASVGPSLDYIKNSFSSEESTETTNGLTIVDTKGITLSTGDQAKYAEDNPTVGTYKDPIKNIQNMAWAHETRLEIGQDNIQVDLANGGDASDGSFFEIQKDNYLTVKAGDGDKRDEFQSTTAGRQGFHSLQAGVIYFDRMDHGATHDSLSSFMVFGNLNVTQGQKNSLVNTSQGWTAVHAYETAEYYFGDIGENNTGANSKVIVGLDQLFAQTVNTDMQYQVFITPYNNAHVWVSQRLNNYFVVESDQPNAEFGWEIKARRRGYEHSRLTNFSQSMK